MILQKTISIRRNKTINFHMRIIYYIYLPMPFFFQILKFDNRSILHRVVFGKERYSVRLINTQSPAHSNNLYSSDVFSPFIFNFCMNQKYFLRPYYISTVLCLQLVQFVQSVKSSMNFHLLCLYIVQTGLFLCPSHDYVIECLPTCKSEDNPPK